MIKDDKGNFSEGKKSLLSQTTFRSCQVFTDSTLNNVFTLTYDDSNIICLEEIPDGTVIWKTSFDNFIGVEIQEHKVVILK